MELSKAEMQTIYKALQCYHNDIYPLTMPREDYVLLLTLIGRFRDELGENAKLLHK